MQPAATASGACACVLTCSCSLSHRGRQLCQACSWQFSGLCLVSSQSKLVASCACSEARLAAVRLVAEQLEGFQDNETGHGGVGAGDGMHDVAGHALQAQINFKTAYKTKKSLDRAARRSRHTSGLHRIRIRSRPHRVGIRIRPRHLANMVCQVRQPHRIQASTRQVWAGSRTRARVQGLAGATPDPEHQQRQGSP